MGWLRLERYRRVERGPSQFVVRFVRREGRRTQKPVAMGALERTGAALTRPDTSMVARFAPDCRQGESRAAAPGDQGGLAPAS